MLIGVQLISITNTASAHPLIKLDYGELEGDIHTFWMVDKGSLVKKGNALTVEVERDDDYASWGMRKYTFKQRNGNWNYRYEEWGGKGNFIRSTSWKKVSEDQMANDVLYIIQN